MNVCTRLLEFGWPEKLGFGQLLCKIRAGLDMNPVHEFKIGLGQGTHHIRLNLKVPERKCVKPEF